MNCCTCLDDSERHRGHLSNMESGFNEVAQSHARAIKINIKHLCRLLRVLCFDASERYRGHVIEYEFCVHILELRLTTALPPERL